MAIRTQFFSFIIPIETIEKKCKDIGGFKGVLELNKKWIGKKVLYDKYLYKDGAMGGDDIDTILYFWEKQGLKLTETKNGITYWKDLAEVDIGNLNGITRPCEWLEYEGLNGGIGMVWMKGKPRGRLIKPFKHQLLHKIRLILNA